MYIRNLLVSGACALGLAVMPLAAQSGGNNGRNNNGVNNVGINNGGGNAANGTGTGVGVAAVPQYWIADADIFTGSAAYTSAVMATEGHVNVEAPRMLETQAQYLVNCINRATRDLAGIDANAIKTNPDAVPAVREAQAQLVAARADANQLRRALDAGGIGPTYEITLKSARNHLQAASKELVAVARAYPGSAPIQSASVMFRMGGAGANGAGGAGAAAAGTNGGTVAGSAGTGYAGTTAQRTR